MYEFDYEIEKKGTESCNMRNVISQQNMFLASCKNEPFIPDTDDTDPGICGYSDGNKNPGYAEQKEKVQDHLKFVLAEQYRKYVQEPRDKAKKNKGALVERKLTDSPSGPTPEKGSTTEPSSDAPSSTAQGDSPSPPATDAQPSNSETEPKEQLDPIGERNAYAEKQYNDLPEKPECKDLLPPLEKVIEYFINHLNCIDLAYLCLGVTLNNMSSSISNVFGKGSGLI